MSNDPTVILNAKEYCITDIKQQNIPLQLKIVIQSNAQNVTVKTPDNPPPMPHEYNSAIPLHKTTSPMLNNEQSAMLFAHI